MHSSWILAAPGAPPAGYQLSNISSAVNSSLVTGINQMSFKPGDTAHLFASRGFSGVVTRYDFNASSGQLSNAVNILDLNSVPDGQKVISGLGFYGNDMWISRWPGWVVPRPSSISRVRDTNNDGLYDSRTDFATGIQVGDHTINQIQILGNSLYIGIGTQKNTGDPNVEFNYGGTIARIADLNNPIAMNLANASDRTTFGISGVNDGRLRMYARGFRNNYGLRVTKDGTVYTADNGASAEGSFPETPDLLYSNIKLNDVGRFPPPGQPGAPTPTMSPITLGEHAGSTGFDFIRTGPDRGNILIGFSSSNTTNGRRLMMVNTLTGAVTNFLTGFSTPTDVVNDPRGRLLISDLDGNAVYRLTPPMDADSNLDRIVDIHDLLALATHWHAPADWYHGDFDRSGFVDAADLGILSSNWQSTSGSLSQALTSLGLPSVPEPSAVGLIVALAALLLKRQVH
jgi:hypothetical protein